MKVKGYSCCKYQLVPGSIIEFHEWDEVFNAEVTTLWLKGYFCGFCSQVYYLAIRGGIHVLQ